MGVSEAIAKQIAASKATKSGNFVKVGKYLFEVKAITAEKKFKGDMFIAEMKVLEATQTDAKHTPNPVGSEASYIVNLGQLSGPGNVKAFIMALFNVPEEQVTAEVIGELCSDKNPAKGMKIRDEAFEKPQKNDPSKMFTYHRWEHVAESIPAAQ
jgi:hypothetical protein